MFGAGGAGESAFADGCSDDLAEHLVDLLDRAGSEGPAGGSDRGVVVGELGDPAFDVGASDAVEADVAPAGEDVVVEVGAVAGVGGAGEALGVEGHAVLGPFAEGDLGGLVIGVGASVDVGLDVAEEPDRVAFAGEALGALGAGGVEPAGSVLAGG